MAIYLIDTEKGTCVPFSHEEAKSSKGERMVDILSNYIGTKEYNGVVADIQKWYYGSLVKAPWCATTLSWLLDKVGIKAKAENVRILLDKLMYVQGCTVYLKEQIPQQLKKGDILFWLWNGDLMTTTSSKHVGLCNRDTEGKDFIECLGGNQHDSISVAQYNRRYLYAIARLED